MAQDQVTGTRFPHRTNIRSMLDALPSPALVIDQAHRIVEANAAYCEMRGRSRDFLISTSMDAYLPPKVVEKLKREHDEAFAEGEDSEAEQCIQQPGGTALHMIVRRRRIDADGEPLILTILTDVTDLRQSEARTRHLAYHDPLTALPNRAALSERLEEAMAKAHRRTALLLIDLYQFKDVNDAFGNAVGDALLRLFANRLAGIAGSNQVARLGGDEFALLLSNCVDAASAKAACRRALALVEAPFHSPAGMVGLNVSVGCAWAEPGVNADELYRRAEVALYAAKQDDGSGFRLFDAAMGAGQQARKTLETEMRAALMAGDQFEVHYQPVMDASTEQVVAMEALVRWHHPQRGLLTPAIFIALAEETGLIVPLGEWVLDQAAALMMRHPDVSLAVNLSPIQLRSPGVDARILAILERRGFPPGRLQLEITEGAMLGIDASVHGRLTRLRDAGVQLVLDDFGTGFSSLSHLHKLNIDRIKIDQSFVRDLGRSQDARAIVQAVLGIGKSLGIGVTAEGVEEEAQCAFLRGHGCHEFQGYLYSRPLPPGDALLFLEAAGERQQPEPDRLDHNLPCRAVGGRGRYRGRQAPGEGR